MSFCCKCKAGMCKTADCDSVCDCHPQEYPNDKETQDWMNAPLGNPTLTIEEQVKFWSDKYDAKVDELHEVWKEARSFEGSFNSAAKSIANQMLIIDRLTQETFGYKKKISELENVIKLGNEGFFEMKENFINASEQAVKSKELLQWVVNNVPSEFWRSNRFRGEALSKIGEIVYGDKVK